MLLDCGHARGQGQILRVSWPIRLLHGKGQSPDLTIIHVIPSPLLQGSILVSPSALLLRVAERLYTVYSIKTTYRTVGALRGL